VFTHDQDAPRVAIIDTTTNRVANWIELPAAAYASAATPDGAWLLVLSMAANRLFVVDLKSLKVARELELPMRSSEILIRPGGDIAYVSGTGAGKIAVLDLRSWEMQQPISLTPGVDGLAWIPAIKEK
jgi:DNA-binding beta-propeller fold protein YncE